MSVGLTNYFFQCGIMGVFPCLTSFSTLKSFWVRIMVFSEKMVCIHNSADENAVIRMGTA